MIQKNLYYQTQREVRRRPKYVSPEDVKNKTGYNINFYPLKVVWRPYMKQHVLRRVATCDVGA